MAAQEIQSWRDKVRDIPTDELAKELLADPLARRYIHRCDASGDNRIYDADSVLGERLARLAGMLLAENHAPERFAMVSAVEGATTKETLLALVVICADAAPYLWSEEVRDTLRQLKLPRHTISPKILPQPRIWHTFETGIGVGGAVIHEGRHLEDATIDVMVTADTGKGIAVTYIGEMRDADTGDMNVMISGAHLLYGKVYPDDFAGTDADGMSRTGIATSTLTMLAFLNSPYIPKQKQRASRAARREALRAGKPVEDEVTFVILRRPASQKHAADGEHSVEWKHRWLVSGHMRAQWYPSEQAHHVIWIAPYLKGPEDAPMLTHAYKVAR